MGYAIFLHGRYNKKCSLEYRIQFIVEGCLQFIEDCPWDELDGFYWAHILTSMPNLSKHCNWQKLKGFDVVTILSRHPQLHIHCDLSNLGQLEWEILLSERPEFAKFKPNENGRVYGKCLRRTQLKH